MKYSFVLIAFNEQNTILSCIESIRNLKDLGNDYEIIVADDGSTDDTLRLVSEAAKFDQRIRIISDGRNHGRGYGRYQGVKHSTGEYVAMVDSDIVLPKNWLTICLQNIGKHDVVGGIAVPDGDAAYVYRKFSLKPKTVMGSTTITGNNGLYKRAVFEKVEFDKTLRDGEDFDFNHRSQAAGFSSFCIPGLTVEHQEHKSFVTSMRWLYQSGVGATRHLFHFKQVRMPDLAFLAIAGSLVLAILLLALASNGLGFIVPILGVMATAFMHLRGKFDLPLNRFGAVLGGFVVNCVLMACYFVGRLVGPIVYLAKMRGKS